MKTQDREEFEDGMAEKWAIRPEAPVIRAWPDAEPQCWRYSVDGNADCRLSQYTAAEVVHQMRATHPGHTIDLSAEPPGGMR